MKLRSGKCFECTPGCSHSCEMWQGYCCSCQDTRPHSEQYIAYNKTNLDDYSIVSRSHYYCPTCKKRCGQHELKKLNRSLDPQEVPPVKMSITTTTTTPKKTFRIFSNEKRIATAVLLKDKRLYQVYPQKDFFPNETLWKAHWDAKMELTVKSEEKKKPEWGFTKTDTKTLPAGQYYIGDPCYALSSHIYDGVFGGQAYEMGLYSTSDDKDFFFVGRTYAGDGCYEGTDGNNYEVDSGTIAILPYHLAEGNDSSFFGAMHRFKAPVECVFNDGVFTFKSALKKIVIET